VDGEPEGAAEQAAESAADEVRFFVKQFRVRGSDLLSAGEIETAVYPFLGPGRTLGDLEMARMALEQAFKEKGYQTVSVQLPVQNGTRGIVFLDVVENRVGRLSVRGSRFFLPSEIKRSAPALAAGSTPDFNQVTREVVALNAWPDRRVTPSIQPGAEPGTVDVDLAVEDKVPLSGSLELNNRYNQDTTELRLNASASYANVWQRGHTFGISTQVAPLRVSDAKVVSAYYLARLRNRPNLSLMFTGTKQDSLISTLGGAAVAGAGEILGVRAMFTLPARGIYFHSLSVGMDSKSFGEDVTIGGDVISTPIDYYPATVAYGGGWSGKEFFTELNASANFHFRGMGSDPVTFDNRRFDATGSWMFLRADLSHTQDFSNGFQAFAKFQGQASNVPLVNSEQFAGGGASTVRGYLEATALGDSGYFVTTELRTPSIFPAGAAADGDGGTAPDEWRFRVFFDGGRLYANETLPEQTQVFDLASFGIGSSLTFHSNLHGSLDLAWPLTDQGITEALDPFLSFQVRSDF
jgi:hemolysin activation/secretion protein